MHLFPRFWTADVTRESKGVRQSPLCSFCSSPESPPTVREACSASSSCYEEKKKGRREDYGKKTFPSLHSLVDLTSSLHLFLYMWFCMRVQWESSPVSPVSTGFFFLCPSSSLVVPREKKKGYTSVSSSYILLHHQQSMRQTNRLPLVFFSRTRVTRIIYSF